MTTVFSIMLILQTHYHFKLDFQKVDQNTWIFDNTFNNSIQSQ